MTQDMQYGIYKELKAREAYTLAIGNNVMETGLWVNIEYTALTSLC